MSATPPRSPMHKPLPRPPGSTFSGAQPSRPPPQRAPPTRSPTYSVPSDVHENDAPPPRRAPAPPIESPSTTTTTTTPPVATDTQQQQRRALHRRSRSFTGRSNAAQSPFSDISVAPARAGDTSSLSSVSSSQISGSAANNAHLTAAHASSGTSASPLPRRPSRPPELACQSASPYHATKNTRGRLGPSLTTSLTSFSRPPGVLMGSQGGSTLPRRPSATQRWNPQRPSKPLPPPPSRSTSARGRGRGRGAGGSGSGSGSTLSAVRLSRPPGMTDATTVPVSSATAAAAAAAEKPPAPSVPKKERRTYIAEEILNTEVSYVEGLEGLLNSFQKPLKETLQPEEDRMLFSNVHILVKFHTYFRSELESRMANWVSNPTIGDVLVQAVPFMKMYTSYVNNYSQLQDLLASLERHNHKFNATLQGCAFGSMEGQLGLISLLLSPIQRIPRYVLLFRDLLKHTPDDHADFEPVTQAYNAVSLMATTINEVKRADEQRTHMRHVLASLSKECRKKMQRSCGELESFEVLKPDRILLREGPALHTKVMTDRDGVSTNKFGQQIKEKRPCDLFLFNESLLVLYRTKHKTAEDDVKSKEDLMGYEFAALIPYHVQETADESSSSLPPGGSMPELRPVGTNAFSLLPPQCTEIHTFHWSDEATAKEWFETLSEALEIVEHNLRVRHQTVSSRAEAGGPPTLAGGTSSSALGSPSPPARHGRFFIPNTAPVPGGGNKMFTAYVIQELSPNGEVIRTILKRYNQFHALNQRLKKTKGVNKKNLPYLPKKKIFGNMDPKFLKKRRRKLTNYLNSLPPEAVATAVVKNFLNTGVEADVTDEELQNMSYSSSDEEEAYHTPPPARWVRSGTLDVSTDATGMATAAAAEDELLFNEEESTEEVEAEFELATVLHDFTAQAATELTIRKGEQIHILSRHDPAWWFAQTKEGNEGYVPEGFVLLEAKR